MVILLGIALSPFGCRPAAIPGESLVIASTWSEAERTELEQAFEHWLASGPKGSRTFGRIEWVRLDPRDDLTRVLPHPGRPWPLRSQAPDVVLGGPESRYRQLALLGRLEADDGSGAASWFILRRSPIGWAQARSEPPVEERADAAARPAGRAARTPRPGPTFDDPRHDPLALAWAEGELESGDWAGGYARLVRAAAGARRIGRAPGSALAAVERGEADSTPAIASSVARSRGRVEFVSVPRAPDWIEGVAIVKDGKHKDRAALFLQFLAGRGMAAPPQVNATSRAHIDSIVADLLGATLVDAQDELWAAWAARARSGHPERAEMWMTQGPPWPPASVTKLLEGDASGSLAATLADLLAPDPDLRAWLLRSWLGAPRLIDGRFIDDLAGAVEGRLAREPRFRAWLRAEWTAWARQRYRRVARTAGESAS
jgi:hypothetical protein